MVTVGTATPQSFPALGQAGQTQSLQGPWRRPSHAATSQHWGHPGQARGQAGWVGQPCSLGSISVLAEVRGLEPLTPVPGASWGTLQVLPEISRLGELLPQAV